MTDVLYDKLVYGRDLTPEQWSKLQYRPANDEDLYGIVENPSFGIDKSEIGPVIPTDRILYTVYTDDLPDDFNGLRSWWIDENTDIEKNTYNKNTGKGELILKEDVTKISGYDDDGWYSAFEDYEGCIESIVLPTQITNIGGGTFIECRELISIIIPNSVTSIGPYAFSGCLSLTSLIIPNSVESIGYTAFRDVKNVIYNGTASGSPWGANTINGFIEGSLIYSNETKSVLTGCDVSAISIIIPNSVTSIGPYAFSYCKSLNSIIIPNSVTSIGYYAFFRCDSLTSVNIPNSMTEIDEYVFDTCQVLSSVTIPNSVESIGRGAFSYCRNLTSVTCLAINPPTLGTNNFTAENDTLYVPTESVQAYLDDTNWNTAFNGNIQAIS